MPAAFMIGHHFWISAFCSAPSARASAARVAETPAPEIGKAARTAPRVSGTLNPAYAHEKVAESGDSATHMRLRSSDWLRGQPGGVA
jgi:hypothetical protein